MGRAPARVAVAAGRVASASLDLMRLPVVLEQEPAAGAAAAPGAIQHESIGCVVEGEFPLIQATIEPASAVARARVYFKSALSDAYYFVEMTPAWDGKLPKPTGAASPLTYYIQAVTTQYGESQTGEIQAQVVTDASECPEGLKVAPIGGPGAVTVFSASTAAVVAPVGFAAAGGVLAGGTLLAATLGAGALAGGIAAATGGGDTTTTTQAPVTTPPTQPPATTLPPVTTTTTTLPRPLPNCAYNEVTRAPLNCPCIELPAEPGTDFGGPPPLQTCAGIGG